MNCVKLAKAYIEKGHSLIPITSQKLPAVPEWKKYQTTPMTEAEIERHFGNCYGIALLCGGRNKVTTIDLDLKYDLSGDLYERYKRKIGKDILKKMYVQKTMSGGYHFVFMCDKLEGNQKLASRYTTEYEQHQTYSQNFNNKSTRSKALKIAFNDKVRVLLETRGEGGYICLNPTPKYEKVYSPQGGLQKLTVEEYDIVLDAARTFNDVREAKKHLHTVQYDAWKLSPFEDYNQRGDVLLVLSQNGWDAIGRGHGRSVRLKRAGHTHSKSSALFDTQTRILNVFSTSTSFDVNKGYNASSVLAHLEFQDDYSQTFKYLIDNGYGKQY